MVGEAETIGQQFWVYFSCLFCECLVIYKFDDTHILQKPFPEYIVKGWTYGFIILTLYMIWKFQIQTGKVQPGSKEEKDAVKNGEIVPNSYPRLSISGSPEENEDLKKIKKRFETPKGREVRKRK